jgi:hypothetical protein
VPPFCPPLARAILLAAVLSVPAPSGRAEDAAQPVVLMSLKPSDPCSFFRGQAWGQGLNHFSQDMLWSCEAIEARRGAGIALSDPLDIVASALDAYRTALVAAAGREFRNLRAAGGSAAIMQVSPTEKTRIAQETGALDAIAALNDAL